MTPRIITKYDPPPMPIRKFDWMATYADYDFGDPIGLGQTEGDAVADLIAQTNEDNM